MFWLNFTGGWREYPEPFTYDDVFMFDSKNSSWIRVGEMEVARRYHGLSLVDKNDVIKYCNWFKESSLSKEQYTKE